MGSVPHTKHQHNQLSPPYSTFDTSSACHHTLQGSAQLPLTGAGEVEDEGWTHPPGRTNREGRATKRWPPAAKDVLAMYFWDLLARWSFDVHLLTFLEKKSWPRRWHEANLGHRHLHQQRPPVGSSSTNCQDTVSVCVRVCCETLILHNCGCHMCAYTPLTTLHILTTCKYKRVTYDALTHVYTALRYTQVITGVYVYPWQSHTQIYTYICIYIRTLHYITYYILHITYYILHST